MDDAKFEADIVKSLRNLGTDKTHINMILDMAVRKAISCASTSQFRILVRVEVTTLRGLWENGWASPGDDVVMPFCQIAQTL